MHQQEAVIRAHESVMDLLKKQFNYEANDEQKKKLDDNAAAGGA